MTLSQRRGGPPAAVATAYKGVIFRSALEAAWAQTLDRYAIDWRYEPRVIQLPSGTRYLPDFWLPAVRTFIEIKGPHMQRAAKTAELAAQLITDGVIALLGFPPQRRSLAPYLWDPFIVWRDPLGYDTRLARCQACESWQWLRAEISRSCRVCGERITGVLAKSGEIPFGEPDDGRIRPMDVV